MPDCIARTSTLWRGPGDERRREGARSPLNIVAGYRPGLVARITEMHALYYARTSGFGQRFESVVAGAFRILRSPREALQTKSGSPSRMGGLSDCRIACHRWEDLGAGIATCAGSIIDDGVRGSGAGRDCSARPMAFVDEKDFAETHLWTSSACPRQQHLTNLMASNASRRDREANGGVRSWSNVL